MIIEPACLMKLIPVASSKTLHEVSVTVSKVLVVEWFWLDDNRLLHNLLPTSQSGRRMNYNINTAAQVPQQQTLLMSTFSIQQRQNQNNNLVGIIHTVTTPTNGNAQDFSTRQCTAIAAAPQGHHLANGQLIRNTSGAVGQTHNFGSDQLASGGIRYVVHGNNGYYSQNQGSNLSDSLGDSAVTVS